MTRPVEITFRNIRGSASLEDEVRARVAWLERFHPNLVGCRVLLEVPHRHQAHGQHVRVRIELSLPGVDAVVNHEPTLHGHAKDVEHEAHRKDTSIDQAHTIARVAIHDAFDAARRRLADLARRQRGAVKTHVIPEGRSAEAYASDMTARVYRAILDRAAVALGAGRSVIVDAVCARPSDRAAVEAVAESASVPFTGIWLDAPGEVLMARTEQRGPDASDADADVVRLQVAEDAGVIRWRRLDASSSPASVLAQARQLEQPPDGSAL